jgi:hypothetical protein
MTNDKAEDDKSKRQRFENAKTELAALKPIDEAAAAQLHQETCKAQLAAADELGVPPWVPKQIRIAAADRYGFLTQKGRQRDAEIVKRLATDDRMEEVWNQLLTRRSRAQKIVPLRLFPSRIALGELGDALNESLKQSGAGGKIDTQLIAAFMLFEAACRAALAPMTDPTIAELRKRATKADKLLSQYHQVASELWRLSGWPKAPAKMEAGLLEAMDIVAEIKVAASRPVTRRRRRTDDALRGFVARVGADMKELFGITGYTIVATLANVALRPEKNFTDARVRALLGHNAAIR